MQTPGAEMRCDALALSPAQFENVANESSRSGWPQAASAPFAPGAPSVSDIALTASTSE